MYLDKSKLYKWEEYSKLYEKLKKELPFELKEVFKFIRKEIGLPTTSFEKIINLNQCNFGDIIVKIIVNFNKSEKNQYYSNINIFDLFEDKIVNIPIEINADKIDIDRLSSVISHEIRHIYDIYSMEHDSDMESFKRSYYIKKLDKNNNYKEFLDLVYLSLEHELIARNSMIYEQFINCKCSKEELIELFKKTFMYESFMILKNFNCLKFIKKFDNYELINNTNEFLNYFKGDKCKNEIDIINFYKRWEEYFKNKSDEYIKEAYIMLDDVYNNIIKEHMEYDTYSSYNEKIKIKEILLNIYVKHIKKINKNYEIFL